MAHVSIPPPRRSSRFFEPVEILSMAFLFASRSAALMKSGSRRFSSTSFFLALLFSSTAFETSMSTASAMSIGPEVARSRIVSMPASFSFCFVAGPTPGSVSSSSSSLTSVSGNGLSTVFW